MNALLWTLALVGLFNTAAVLLAAATGGLGQVSFGRAFDWFWTAGLGLWAFYLLVTK